MDTIRQSTIEQLRVVSPRLDPIRQIKVAHQYNYTVLVDEPIQNLIARTQRLTLEETRTLPVEDLHTIMEGREIRANIPRCTRCNPYTHLCNTCRARMRWDE